MINSQMVAYLRIVCAKFTRVGKFSAGEIFFAERRKNCFYELFLQKLDHPMGRRKKIARKDLALHTMN
jgi:hypothetical protein